jgi:hypothetical protein
MTDNNITSIEDIKTARLAPVRRDREAEGAAMSTTAMTNLEA